MTNPFIHSSCGSSPWWPSVALALLALAVSGCAVSDPQGRRQSATLQGSSPPTSLAGALDAVDAALHTGLDTPAEEQAYNAAVENVVQFWTAATDGDTPAQRVPQVPGYDVKVIAPADLCFDELILARTVKSKVMNRRVTRDGLGAPYVAHWTYTEERAKTAPFMTKGGYIRPVTATVEVVNGARGGKQARLTFHETRTEETVKLDGKTRPLAADFTAVGEYVVAMKAGSMPKLAALLRSGKYLGDLQLISLEPIDGKRIPLIFVHGLMSRPATWQQVYNELQAVPEIREKYQILFFRYPSGVPVIYSATKFRENLTTLYTEMDKRGGHQLSYHTVVIGHSMGGLVTKLQVEQGGEKVWIGIFGKPRSQLHLTAKAESELSRYLDFNPDPHVERVIFAATPHRGSNMADGTLGSIGRKLVSLPGNLLGGTFTIIQELAPDNGALATLLAKGVPNSIDNLSPRSQFVKTSMALPLRPGLKINTIAGNKKNLPLDNPKAGDGVVPYSSAHLDGVESELVIAGSGHGVHETPEAQAEIERILLLQLKQDGEIQ